VIKRKHKKEKVSEDEIIKRMQKEPEKYNELFFVKRNRKMTAKKPEEELRRVPHPYP
jgi:hypothetical protein